jgi:AraC-like DNA-binding protein
LKWSLSEFLNLIELRSQTWCHVSIAIDHGFRIPHSEGVLFYAVLNGSAQLSWGVGQMLSLEAGDVAILLSGDAHTVRCPQGAAADVLDFLANGNPVDAPMTLEVGRGAVAGEILCGRLKARWPTARKPLGLPPILVIKAADGLTNISEIYYLSKSSGGTSLLTRMAMMLFTAAFRVHPDCDAVFRGSGYREPIAQAVNFIETHPFTDWTVDRLARKVGMGRSNFALRFTVDVGCTPMAFVTEQRMKHAADFLERTDLKIAEIAERVGYRSESAFSHRFNEHFGISPGALRQRRREIPASTH